MEGRPGSRPLSRSLDPIAGESLGGYLLRLSWRLRTSPLSLARHAGCAGDGQPAPRRRLLLDLDAERFAQATRLSADEARSLTVTSWAGRYPPVSRSKLEPGGRVVLDGWLFSSSVRYCPDCLAGDGSPVQQEYGGPWKKEWHLPVVFACLRHHQFLREGCPREHPDGPEAWRLVAFPSASALHPAQCRHPVHTRGDGQPRTACCTRLDQPGEDGLPRPGTAILDLQERLLTLLSPQHPAQDAARAFTDLRVISALLCQSWPLAEDLTDHHLATAVSQHVRRLRIGHQPTLDRQPNGALATAGLLTAAAAVRNSTDLESALARHLRPDKQGRLSRWDGPNPTWTRILDRHQSTCSQELLDAATTILAGQHATPRR